MDPVLDYWQRKALSECTGETILEFFHDDPPPWTQVGTDILEKLRSLVVERLRKKNCNDVANALEGAKEFTTKALHQRFKSLREKRRREQQRREAEKQAALRNTSRGSVRPPSCLHDLLTVGGLGDAEPTSTPSLTSS